MATPHVTGIIAYAMANATLARSPALMKEWLRMTALELKDGTLMANNGVHANSGEDQGLVGLNKIPVKSAMHVSEDSREGPVKGKRDAFEVDAEAEMMVEWKRASKETLFEGVDQEMACRREAQMTGNAAFLQGKWLCNSRAALARRGLEGLRRVLRV